MEFLLFKNAHCSRLSKWDAYGVEFEDNKQEVLISAPKGLTDYVIPRTCIRIKSGGDAEHSSFYPCSTTLKSLACEAGSKLTTIDRYTFNSIQSLESVDFSNCLEMTEINERLFTYCYHVTTLKLPPNVVKILSTSFFGFDISEVTIPDSCTYIGFQCFCKTPKLKKVIITENSQLEIISSDAFYLSAINEFYFPKNLKQFDGSSFGKPVAITIHPDNTNFKRVDDSILTADNLTLLYFCSTGVLSVPDTVKNIASNALKYSNITTITFKLPLNSTGNWWCAVSQIQEITIPDGITEIVDHSFYSCKQLHTCILTESITKIQSYAFEKCESLTTIELKNTESIGYKAFANCKLLGDVSFPATLKEINQGVFSGCPKLNIDASKNDFFDIVDGMLFSNNKKELKEFFGSKHDIVIPSQCTIIGFGVFLNKDIRTVTFNNADKITIGGEAFKTTNIKKITLPANLVSIGIECFSYCKLLSEVTFQGLENKNISESAFMLCPVLSKVTLPGCVTGIHSNAFKNCPMLSTINLNETSLATIEDSAFAYTSVKVVSLPASFTDFAVKSFYKSMIEELDMTLIKTTTIPSNSFEYCTNLVTVKFADSITDIGIEAFCGCTNLTSISLPQDIQFIRAMAFYGCTSLSAVEIPLNCNLEYIYGKAFGNCPLLKEFSVDKEDGNFTFEDGILMNKEKTKLVVYLPTSNIELFVVPANIHHVGNYAFQDCTNLKTVIIADGNIKGLGAEAFSGCTKLSLIYLPKSISTIAKNVFKGCTSLKCGSIICPEKLKESIKASGSIIKDTMFSDVCVPPKTQCFRQINPYVNMLHTLCTILFVL